MENSSTESLLQTPIHGWHKSNNAKLADFGGWEMPIEYGSYLNQAGEKGGVLAEHAAVRESVGLFDVSHLGKIEVSGKGALDFLNQILTNDLSKITDGQAQYNMICNESGGVIDDLIVYRRNSDDCLLIPNAANCQAVFETLLKNNSADLKIANAHTKFAVIALQGPNTNQVLDLLGIKLNLDYMSFTSIEIPNHPELGEVIVCRTGYTGEFGYEFLPKWESAPSFWALMEAAVLTSNGRVCGLGSRDTLRTEMGYPLHGHELSLEISPLQANAGWAVALNKEKFLGSQSLKQEKAKGVHRVLRGLQVLDKGIPRADMAVRQNSENNCGVITSGTFSPTLKQGIALALIEPKIEIGSIVEIDIRGRVSTAKVVKPPFVASHVR
jgi:aminomethyltransferase